MGQLLEEMSIQISCNLSHEEVFEMGRKNKMNTNELDITELQFLEHDLEKLWKRTPSPLTYDEFDLLVRAVLVLVQDKIRYLKESTL